MPFYCLLRPLTLNEDAPHSNLFYLPAMCMFARFAWIYFATLDKPWNVDTVAFPFEGFVWVAYLFLGLVFWLSDEMEHLDYKRTFSERSSK